MKRTLALSLIAMTIFSLVIDDSTAHSQPTVQSLPTAKPDWLIRLKEANGGVLIEDARCRRRQRDRST